MNTLPRQFVENMAGRLGDELPAFLRSYEEPYLRGIRLNPLKAVEAAALPEGIGEPVPWEPLGRYLAMDSDAGATPLHEAGAFYLQEPSAMLAMQATVGFAARACMAAPPFLAPVQFMG